MPLNPSEVPDAPSQLRAISEQLIPCLDLVAELKSLLWVLHFAVSSRELPEQTSNLAVLVYLIQIELDRLEGILKAFLEASKSF